jgi:guanylate cyclase
MRFATGFAYDTADAETTRAEKVAVFIVAALCCLAGLIWSATYCAVLGWGLTAALPLAFTVLVGTALLIAHMTKAHRIAVHAQLLGIICVTTFLQWSLGGLFDSGFVLVWAFLGPIGALFFFPVRRAIPWFLLFLLAIALTVVLDGYFGRNGPVLPAAAQTLFFVMNLSFSASIVFVFAAYFVNAATVQRKRADDLLLNTLPEPIVNSLKSGTKTIANHYESASVLFADIVESTRVFAGLSPAEVVEWLNEVFSAFDRIVARHGAEKIRTIGDNYMVAAGVPGRRSDHAKLLARVALDMVAVQKLLPTLGSRRLAFRIGINSGPLVAGVIGTAKFQYDLWGDTVNVAARMETHGEPGRVHLSDATYQLIKDDFEAECRNGIPIKGRGTMITWYLTGPREPARPDPAPRDGPAVLTGSP